MRDIHSGDKENDTFNELLNKFDAADGDKKKLNALIEEAKTRAITFRQKEAVIARCESTLNGTYGKSKRPEHYAHTKTN